MDALKKAKDKKPKCIVTPIVKMQKKGVLAANGYKGVFSSLDEARTSDKTICFIPARDGQVYERRVPCPMSVLFASGNLHAKTLSSPAQTLYAAGNARIAAPPERRSTMPGFRCIAISKSGMARRFILGS